jgi:hypothetical protein
MNSSNVVRIKTRRVKWAWDLVSIWKMLNEIQHSTLLCGKFTWETLPSEDWINVTFWIDTSQLEAFELFFIIEIDSEFA